MSVTVTEETNEENEGSGAAATTVAVVGEAAIGEVVSTPYGEGRVVAYRDEDGTYVVRLVGTTDNTNDTVVTTTADNGDAIATLFTKDITVRSKAEKEQQRNRETIELNAAYGSFEKLRRLNFELKCFEAGIQHVDHDQCTTCVFTKPELHGPAGSSTDKNRFPRLQKFVDKANATMTEVSESVTAATTSSHGSSRSTTNSPNENSVPTSTIRFPGFSNSLIQQALPYLRQHPQLQPPQAQQNRTIARQQEQKVDFLGFKN